MPGDLQFTEDLPRIATESFELANQLCGSCKNFHMLWPYLRLAGASGGDVGIAAVHSVLARLLAGTGRSILIAGSADTGLLAVVARAAGATPDITVADQCATPLELCRRFAVRRSLPVKTLHQNFSELAGQSAYDVVFAHMLLQYIPAARRLDALARFRRALRSDGRLVILYRTSGRIEGELLPEYRNGYATHLIAQLEAANITLPESRAAFRRRVEDYAEERRRREGAHTSRDEVERLIEAAGFTIEETGAIKADHSAPFRQFETKIAKQRYLAVAAPSRAS